MLDGTARFHWSPRTGCADAPEGVLLGGRVFGSGDRGGGVALPELEQEQEILRDAPWNVVVHNDPVNLMSYVTKVFQKVFGLSVKQAEKHMLEVHHKGRSVVWTGSREKAELYVQQLHGYLLLSTLEKSV
jgi:ATP-dependent Clp protease adaptor protein ClpS